MKWALSYSQVQKDDTVKAKNESQQILTIITCIFSQRQTSRELPTGCTKHHPCLSCLKAPFPIQVAIDPKSEKQFQEGKTFYEKNKWGGPFPLGRGFLRRAVTPPARQRGKKGRLLWRYSRAGKSRGEDELRWMSCQHSLVQLHTRLMVGESNGWSGLISGSVFVVWVLGGKEHTWLFLLSSASRLWWVFKTCTKNTQHWSLQLHSIT